VHGFACLSIFLSLSLSVCVSVCVCVCVCVCFRLCASTCMFPYGINSMCYMEHLYGLYGLQEEITSPLHAFVYGRLLPVGLLGLQ